MAIADVKEYTHLTDGGGGASSDASSTRSARRSRSRAATPTRRTSTG